MMGGVDATVILSRKWSSALFSRWPRVDGLSCPSLVHAWLH